MDFKDRMIDAIERGVPEDEAYDHVRDQLGDAADVRRKEPKLPLFSSGNPELAREASELFGEGPPVFIVGDRVVVRDEELGALQGTVTRADLGSPYVSVKLDLGGTYPYDRSELRRLTG